MAKATKKKTKTASKTTGAKTAKPKTASARSSTASAQTATGSNPFGLNNDFFNGKTPINNAMETFMTQGNPQFDKMTQDAQKMGRDGFDAFVKSGTIFAKGMEDLMRESMALAQDAAEKQAEYVKQALSAKSLNEWTDTQNKIAQASFDDFMTGATKISELSVRLLTEASEPLNTQMSKSMKKATETMAA